MKLDDHVKLFSAKTFVFSVMVVLIGSTPVFAEHRDLAPLPKDAVKRLLENFNVGAKTDPLPTILDRHLEDAAKLIKQIVDNDSKGKTDSSATKRMLLESKVQELNVLREEIRKRFDRGNGRTTSSGQKSSTSKTSLLNLIEQRFDHVTQALETVSKSKGMSKSRRAKALDKAKKVLYELHKGPKQRRETIGAGPVPTYTQGKPTKRKPGDLPKAPAPQYLASESDPANNMYAFLGDTILAVAPQPTPVEAQTCDYLPADLGQSQEVQLTPEIQALAQSLSYSPVKIYQYVSNEIDYEPYFGSLKGAMGTLYSKAGNPTDQASLLIALLRASNIPARYILGTAQFDDDPRVLRWIGAKDYGGAGEILRQGRVDTDYDIATKHIEFSHVWVEACVPYGNYRGLGIDKTGHRWIPLDPSFKEKNYQEGIVANVEFDYAAYMAERTNGPDSLPHEQYIKEVETAIKLLPPKYSNNTVEDVGYIGAYVMHNIDILPASLPYRVKSFNAWDTGLTAETAEVPDRHRYKFGISTTGFSESLILSMPEVVLKRITLSYRGSTDEDQTKLEDNLTSGEIPGISCAANKCTIPPLYVVPVIKADGTEIIVGDPVNYFRTVVYPSSGNLVSQIFAKTSLSMKVELGGTIFNAVNFTDKINMYDHYALHAYAFQASDRLLTERADRLLESINTIPNPISDPDETIGEFLHLVGLKFMRYITDAGKRIGELDGGSGLSGNHLGITSSHIVLEYIFDLPFGVPSMSSTTTGYPPRGLLIDFPGGQSRSVDITTGNPVWKTFLLSGYTASAYESYIWQENAMLDAVSTVRGIQFAHENNIEVLTIDSNNRDTEIPRLTSNTDSALNYPQSRITQINKLLDEDNTVTLPRHLLDYENWRGVVWVSENNSLPGFMQAGFAIGGSYAGGWSVGSFIGMNYDPFLNTGYSLYSSLGSIGTIGMPPVLSSWVGPGLSAGNTWSGDPVNMVTGNMYHTERDITLKSRGLPIVFERSYNSRDSKDGPLGLGWTHSLNHYLLFEDDNVNKETDAGDTDNITSSVTWVDGTSSEKFIQVSGAASGVAVGSSFTAPDGYYFQTTRNTDGSYSVRKKNGLTYTFESVDGTIGEKAKLISIKDRNNNTITLCYTRNNLASVTDGLGRSVKFTYNARNHIIEIQDWAGRRHQYHYDYESDLNAKGKLIGYKNPLAAAGKQNPVSYEYYDDPDLNYAMKRYVLPRGNSMTFEYYMNGKVFKHYNSLGETMKFTYNDFRRETVSINERGFTRRYFFDENGNPLQIIEENGGIQEFTYDPDNPMNRISKRDPMGYVAQYAYDADGNVTRVTNPSGSTVEYSHFDVFNQPGKTKDANGNFTLNKYDANGNMLQEIRLVAGIGAAIDPASYVPKSSEVVFWTINTYDSFGNIVTTKQVRDFGTRQGPLVEYDYNDTANNTLGLNAVGVTRQGDKNGDGVIGPDEFDIANLSYDALGRLLNGISEAWYPTQFEYDDVDRVIRGTDENGNLRDFHYDENGNSVGEELVMTRLGAPMLNDQSSATYDMSDRKLTETNAGGFVTRYEYDVAGNVVKVINPDNYNIRFEYNANNQAIKAYDEEGHVVSRTVDLVGKSRTITDPNGNTLQYEYYGPEQDGRLARQFDAMGRKTEYDYDANGNVTTVTDNLSRTTITRYDELDRPVRIVQPQYTHAVLGNIHHVTRYEYDTLGNLVKVKAGYTADSMNPAVDVVSTQMTYAYDDFGRKISETNPLAKRWSYAYDVHGNVTSFTDPKNQIVVSSYGYGGLLESQKVYAFLGDTQPHVTTYTRNALGQPKTVVSPEVIYHYEYDAAHRLTRVLDGRSNKAVEYNFSPGGLLNSQSGPDGQRQDYVYDPVGRLTSIWANNNDQVIYSYDAGGRLTQKRLSNGITSDHDYNADNTLASLTNRNSEGSVISRHVYTYDAVGNRETVQQTIATATTHYRYSYDSLNRLKAVHDEASATLIESYTYDALGNRTGKIDASATLVYLYDAANQLKEVRSGSETGPVVTSFMHDDNGNLTQKTEGGSTLDLTYDALDRLVEAQKSGLPQERYAYDPQGRRISKIVGNAANLYVYSGPDIVAQYSGWNDAPTTYAHGPYWDDPILRAPPNAAAQYYHADGLGSIVAMTDATGTVSASASYDAWGQRLAGTGSIAQYGYTGREPDATGLIYYRARYYDPSVGRFTQSDPKGFIDGINRYAYAINNPVNYTDPRGTSVFDNSFTNISSFNSSYFNINSNFGGLSAGGQRMFSITQIASPVTSTTSSVGSRTADFGLGFIPGYDLVQAFRNPNATFVDYAVGVLGVLPGVGKAAGLGVKGVQTGVRASRGAANRTLSIPQSVGARAATTRVRHFTNKSSLSKIQDSGVINAGDKGCVFCVPASQRVLSPRNTEAALGIKRGRGNAFIEFDAGVGEFDDIVNPLTRSRELIFRGNIDLTGRNPTFNLNR